MITFNTLGGNITQHVTFSRLTFYVTVNNGCTDGKNNFMKSLGLEIEGV